MKKLMIAAAIVCAAAMAQATSVNWQQNLIQLDGNFDDPDGSENYAPKGWQMYLFDSYNTEATTYAQMQALLAAATTEAGYASWKTAMGDNIKIGEINDQQKLSVNGIDMTEKENAFKGYAVLINAETLNDATYAFLVAEDTFAKGASTTAISFGEDFGSPAGNYINALDYSTKDNWSAVGAVPEPTSGLLLLIGVAGLALRRLRA